jgi:hypothetical protein
MKMNSRDFIIQKTTTNDKIIISRMPLSMKYPSGLQRKSHSLFNEKIEEFQRIEKRGRR